MDLRERQRAEKAVRPFLNESLERILLNNPTQPEQLSKARLRPLLIKGELKFQVEEQVGRQVFHRNMGTEETVEYLLNRLERFFRQAELESALGSAVILVSKKGRVTAKLRKKAPDRPVSMVPMSHNRIKHYILQEGIPVPFLVDLGVMMKDGSIVKSHYDKFRQINRFLEMLEDVLPDLNQNRENTIIDFGCGKSYLTFAMYYYLNELKKYPARIIGLDLKEDIISRCSDLAAAYGYDGLSFCCGDIASYTCTERVDMVVTLHACDLATDYALAKAVSWGAGVILSVPCCQHQLNKQIGSKLLEPVLQYGLIKERMAALYTDAIRAQVLEHMGYRTQILEFIDMEHTPKNILIRAVKQGEIKDNEKELRELTRFLQVTPEIMELLMPESPQ